MTKPLSAEILTRMDYFIKTIYNTTQKRHFGVQWVYMLHGCHLLEHIVACLSC